MSSFLVLPSVSTPSTLLGPVNVPTRVVMDVHLKFYPPSITSFKMDNFYWPSQTSSFGAAISRLLPHYPACLECNLDEDNMNFSHRILSYHFWVDRFVYRVEDQWRKKMKIIGISCLNQEKILGVYFFFLS
jgi:hypothetical protein